MLVQVQWATDPPEDWVNIDSKDWWKLPKKDEPIGNEILDSTPGWVCRMNIQGVPFVGFDHYALWEESATGAVYFAGWANDLEERPNEEFEGQIWIFQPVFDSPPYTNQILHIYDGSIPAARRMAILNGKKWMTTGGLVNQYKFTDYQWSNIPNKIVRHGIWMSDELYLAHKGFKPADLRAWLP